MAGRHCGAGEEALMEPHSQLFAALPKITDLSSTTIFRSPFQAHDCTPGYYCELFNPETDNGF